MARDIEVDAKVNDKSAPGLDSFSRRVKKTGKDAEKEFDRFGNSAGGSILKSIESVSPKLAASLASGLEQAGTLGGPLMAAGIAAALPVLSGLVGSAVAGGAAGAGIIGGVALAAQDARVKQAGSTLGKNLLATLSTQASGYIGPVLTSIDLIGDRFSENGDRIESIFNNSARFVVPLADSLADLGESLLKSIETGVSRAAPVMRELDSGLTRTGQAIESLVDDVTENADFNAGVLRDTFTLLTFTIEQTGNSLKVIGDVFGFLDKIIPLSPLAKVIELFDDTDESARRSTGGTFGAANGMQLAGDAAETAKADTDLYNKALEDNARAAEQASQAERSLFDDTTRVGQAFDNAREAAKKNGRTLSENTDKGRANRQALSELANSLNTYRSDLAKSGATTSTVNGVLTTQRKRFYDVALSMTGSSKKARELTNTLLGIPSPKPKVTLNTSGVASQARNAREEIASVKGKTVTVTVNVNASRLASVEKRLARIDSYGYAGQGGSFGAFATDGSGLNRVGGPAAVSATVENRIFLDGEPFYRYTDRAIARERDRAQFRQRVGRRN